MFGIFVVAGVVLRFSTKLGIDDWAHPIHGWLVAALIFSGAVLLTYLGSGVYSYISDRMSKQQPVDLRLVVGNPILCQWGIAALGDKPVMSVSVAMNFAHHQRDFSIIIKQAYLKGTRAAIRIFEIVVDGPHNGEKVIHMTLLPIKAKRGTNLKSRVVFVDQFNGKHVSERITFTPRTVPLASRGQRPLNCFFCHKTVDPSDLAENAAIIAHIKCIWS
jgi:hypothetical protein